MKVEGGLFIGCAVFFAGADIVYWYFSHDPTGTAALAFAVGLAFLTGFYVLFTGRRLPKRPEDDLEGEIEEGAGEEHRAADEQATFDLHQLPPLGGWRPGRPGRDLG